MLNSQSARPISTWATSLIALFAHLNLNPTGSELTHHLTPPLHQPWPHSSPSVSVSVNATSLSQLFKTSLLVFVEYLLCARFCSRFWGLGSEQKSLPSWSLHSSQERQKRYIYIHIVNEGLNTMEKNYAGIRSARMGVVKINSLRGSSGKPF